MTEEQFTKIQAEVHLGDHIVHPGEGDTKSSVSLSVTADGDAFEKVWPIMSLIKTSRVATIIKRKGMPQFRCVAKLKYMRGTPPKKEGDRPSASFMLVYTDTAEILSKLTGFLMSIADLHPDTTMLTMEQMQPELPPAAQEGGEGDLPLD